MPKRDDSKIRLLLVERMLCKDKFITAPEISVRLEKRYGIRVDKKTIYSDLYSIDRVMPLEFKVGRNGGVRVMDFKWE